MAKPDNKTTAPKKPTTSAAKPAEELTIPTNPYQRIVKFDTDQFDLFMTSYDKMVVALEKISDKPAPSIPTALVSHFGKMATALEKMSEKPAPPVVGKSPFEKKDDQLVIALATNRQDTYVSPGDNFADVRREIQRGEDGAAQAQGNK